MAFDFHIEASKVYLEKPLPRYWREWEDFDWEMERWCREYSKCNWDCRNYEAIWDDIENLAERMKELVLGGVEKLPVQAPPKWYGKSLRQL